MVDGTHVVVADPGRKTRSYPRAMGRRRIDLRPAIESLRVTLSDRDLRRLVTSWFMINFGKWAFLVTNLVIAYEVGGAYAVGIMGLARYLTPTVIAPFAGLPVARWRAERVLLAANGVRWLGVALATVVVAIGGSIELLYLAVAIEAGAGAFTRPLYMALLPCVARTPEQLIAANVTSSAAEGLGTFLGPALGGLLLATVGVDGANVAVLVIYLLGLLALVGLDVPVVGRSDGSVRAVIDQISAGVRTVASVAGPRLVFIGFGLQTFVRGLLTVLIVVTAIDLLGLGDPGVGALNAALGLGGLVGAFAGLILVGRERLAPAFTAAMVGWGAPIAVIGLLVDPIVALLAMLVIGVSNALIDVAGFTLAQRTSPNDSRVAVLGLIDSAANAGVALGGIVAPVLIDVIGVRGALVATGAILPVAAIAVWPALRRVDEGGVAMALRSDLLREVPMFRPLSLAAIDHLAGQLEPVALEDGEWLMREGERGDRYVVVESGSLEISQGSVVINTVGRGDGVGEIALLRDVPRTASVRAIGPVTGWSLDRGSFLEAVTGHSVSRTLAIELVDERLATNAST
jgi:MFS family permease